MKHDLKKASVHQKNNSQKTISSPTIFHKQKPSTHKKIKNKKKNIKKNDYSNNHFQSMVVPPGIEPGSRPPQRRVLSVERRDQKERDKLSLQKTKGSD